MQKVIVVTGGSRGIGAATALLAAKVGYAVCINYQRNQIAADAIAQQIINNGGDAITVKGDVSQEAEVVALFEHCFQRFGAIHALVNNAGMIAQETSLKHMSAERLQRMFAVNITGSFLCAREAVKHMSTVNGGQGGTIVNVSSAAARLGSPNEFIDYAASKGAIDTMTIGLAKEVATEGIRVNAVRPGLIDTDLHADSGDRGRPERLKNNIPMQRVGTAAEVANSILWLLSDDASYLTGSIVDIAGGR